MKVEHSIELGKWVEHQRESLSGAGRGTLADVADRAEKDLGFKVPTGCVRNAMKANGIETRRVSNREAEKLTMLAEIEKLTAENMALKRTLAKVKASEYVPDDFKDYVFSGLNEEIVTAILSQD